MGFPPLIFAGYARHSYFAEPPCFQIPGAHTVASLNPYLSRLFVNRIFPRLHLSKFFLGVQEVMVICYMFVTLRFFVTDQGLQR